MSESDVQVGAVLAGKYRVERVLGRGGMGVVVEATQLDLERRVALKFLRKAVLLDTTVALSRFEREARTVARLRGAHVVQIYDVGRLEHGEPFIVMELLHGEDLAGLLDRELKLPIATAVDYVLQACEAMAEAHVAGVVHRDLKPANLFLTRGSDGRPLVKVLDFGISKLTASETTSLSLTSGVLGSPLYMSPEQLSSSKSVDYRTDIWSLGTILYELITGQAAFHADGLPQVCTRVMLGAPDAMSQFVDHVPSELEATILTCLSKAPNGRHLSVADLALALVPFARGGAHRSVEAAIHIVRGSNIPHGELPSMLDSMPPPSPATTSQPAISSDTLHSGVPSPALRAREHERETFGSDQRTINVSGAPPGMSQGITQAELKPLVSPAATTPHGEARSARPRALLWAGVALTSALAVLIGLSLGSSAGPPAPAEAASPLIAPLASVVPPASAVASPPPPAVAAVPEPAASASALASTAPSAPPRAAPSARTPAARKQRPAPRSTEPNPEELLKHR